MHDDILRLKAVTLTQIADVSSLLQLLQEVAAAARAAGIEMPDVSTRFLALRKETLHRHLEAIETTDPAHAAQLQQVIDESSLNYPFDFEG